MSDHVRAVRAYEPGQLEDVRVIAYTDRATAVLNEVVAGSRASGEPDGRRRALVTAVALGTRTNTGLIRPCAVGFVNEYEPSADSSSGDTRGAPPPCPSMRTAGHGADAPSD
jgi:hypothetical protein